MLILALDTTTRSGSVALVRDQVVLDERSGDASRTHGERLPLDIMAACDAAGVGIREVNLFAVAAGPGSFTGLRIGIAVVQGLGTAWGRKIVPVSTFEAVAATAPEAAERVVVWVDAQRGQVFAQVLRRVEGLLLPLTEAIAAPPADALAAHASAGAGAEFHGDGAVRYRDAILAERGPAVTIADHVPPLAAAIARLARARCERAVRPADVTPVYVRRPDAELARDARARRS